MFTDNKTIFIQHPTLNDPVSVSWQDFAKVTLFGKGNSIETHCHVTDHTAQTV